MNASRRSRSSASPVGIVGLGIMGLAMAENLLKAGHAVCGFDVRASRLERLAARGGRPLRSAAEVARRAPVVITSLPSAGALDAVVGEIVDACRPRSAWARTRGRGEPLVVETSTLRLDDKRYAQRRLAAVGATLLDCPLSGTGAQARTKDLVVYASGSVAAYRRIVPVLEGFARAHHHVGPFGAGTKTKIVANLLVAIHNVAAAEAIVLGRKAGLDPDRLLEVVGAGAGASRMLQVRGPRMVARDYSPMMTLDLWQKDMSIIADHARSVGAPTLLFTLCAALYTAAVGRGHAGHDSAAVYDVVESLAADR